MDKCIIAAVSKNGVIGDKGKLLWNIPTDMKYFKSETMGHPVIMGRKTYESIGRPLPGRTNIVLTKGNIDGVICADNIDDAIEAAEKNDGKKCFIIGGGSIYKQMMDDSDYLYITRVHKKFEGDTLFPEIDEEKWELLGESDKIEDEKSGLEISFLIFSRKLL